VDALASRRGAGHFSQLIAGSRRGAGAIARAAQWEYRLPMRPERLMLSVCAVASLNVKLLALDEAHCIPESSAQWMMRGLPNVGSRMACAL